MYDYLVVGAGVSGMCFIDVILRCTNQTILLVDKNDLPGGHWHDPYPYVQLHQNAHTYGIESIDLKGEDGSCVKKHFELALEKFKANRNFECIFNTEINLDSINIPHKTLVDATYLMVHRLPTKWNMMNPWNLNTVKKSYVIVGGGKTGMDTCIFLIKTGIAPRNITWVISNDAVWLKREKINDLGPAPRSVIWSKVQNYIVGLLNPLFAIKLDNKIFSLSETPTRHRCAIIKDEEYQDIKRVNMVRKGYVKERKNNTLYFTNGESISFEEDVGFVDCIQNGTPAKDPVDIFQPNKIVIQPIVMCQLCFSSTIIAKMEAYGVQSLKLIPIKNPKTVEDGVVNYSNSMVNLALLNNSAIAECVFTSRLNPYKIRPKKMQLQLIILIMVLVVLILVITMRGNVLIPSYGSNT